MLVGVNTFKWSYYFEPDHIRLLVFFDNLLNWSMMLLVALIDVRDQRRFARQEGT